MVRSKLDENQSILNQFLNLSKPNHFDFDPILCDQTTFEQYAFTTKQIINKEPKLPWRKRITIFESRCQHIDDLQRKLENTGIHRASEYNKLALYNESNSFPFSHTFNRFFNEKNQNLLYLLDWNHSVRMMTWKWTIYASESLVIPDKNNVNCDDNNASNVELEFDSRSAATDSVVEKEVYLLKSIQFIIQNFDRLRKLKFTICLLPANNFNFCQTILTRFY